MDEFAGAVAVVESQNEAGERRGSAVQQTATIRGTGLWRGPNGALSYKLGDGGVAFVVKVQKQWDYEIRACVPDGEGKFKPEGSVLLARLWKSQSQFGDGGTYLSGTMTATDTRVTIVAIPEQYRSEKGPSHSMRLRPKQPATNGKKPTPQTLGVNEDGTAVVESYEGDAEIPF